MDPFVNTVPGFLCSYTFTSDGQAAAMLEKEAGKRLTQAGDWFWLHLNLTDQRCRKWLQGQLQDCAVDWQSFCQPADRPVLKQEHRAITGKIIALSREHGEGFAQQSFLHLVMTDKFLITGRTRPLNEPDTMRGLLSRGKTCLNPGELLALLVGLHIEELEDMSADLYARLEHIEDDVFDDGRTAERQDLMAARRDGTFAHRLVRTSRRLYTQAARNLDGWPQHMDANIQRLANLDQDLEVLEQRARFLHDELDAKLAAETNRQLYFLSIITAIFLPPSLVAGLFGMNLHGIPAAESPFGFWIAAATGLISAGLVGLIIRRTGRR